MTADTRVRDFQRARRDRPDEAEWVTANINVRDGLLDLGHVACDDGLTLP